MSYNQSLSLSHDENNAFTNQDIAKHEKNNITSRLYKQINSVFLKNPFLYFYQN